jgi:formimidoylglutamate deiminase
VIDLFEEARLVEYNERLQRLERVILSRPSGAQREPAPALVQMATSAGARSLRVDAGALSEGSLADFIAVDLDHVALAGWNPDSLASLVMLAAPADIVRDVWVGGKHVVTDRTHETQEDATRAFNLVASRR